jgi:endonuclease/exonuclease/phosphatase family metal-dependent hydrolase
VIVKPSSILRLITYNMGMGGSRNPDLWTRLLPALAPDLLFTQESRDPEQYWPGGSWLWSQVPSLRWGTGLWVRDGRLTPLSVPEDFTGRVVAALVEGLTWPVAGTSPVVALSIHAPTRRGSTYTKEVGRILDFAGPLAGGLPLVLAGDFNVAVGTRGPNHLPALSRGETALLERLRNDFDLIPCWQTAHPGERLARTLRWMRRPDSLPYHCDGIFIPANWAPALRDCAVLEDGEWSAVSDHNPVVAALIAS